jgi:Mn2+/Fe2+ NRAMP family transporter
MAVVGATTVYGLSWLALLVFPLLAVIQAIAARVGTVTRDDLQSVVRERFHRPWGLLLMASVLAVCAITIAADLEAGAAALGLLVHLPWRWFVAPLGLAVLAVVVLGSYDEVRRVLTYVLLVLLAYVVATFLAHPGWGSVLHHSVIPTFHWTSEYVAGSLALLGTSLTSYVYIWATIEEAEERPPPSRLRLREVNAVAGILFAVLIMWFILLATGATLGVHHLPVQTAQEAARALAPVAGRFAGELFGIGLLGSALLALPVLLGTCAYVVGAEFDWRRGLSRSVRRAPAFYAIAAGAITLGAVLAFSGTSPIHLLFLASIAGGLGTPIGMVFLLLVASDRAAMRGRAIGGSLRVAGWAVAVVIGGMSLAYLVQQLAGG